MLGCVSVLMWLVRGRIAGAISEFIPQNWLRAVPQGLSSCPAGGDQQLSSLEGISTQHVSPIQSKQKEGILLKGIRGEGGSVTLQTLNVFNVSKDEPGFSLFPQIKFNRWSSSKTEQTNWQLPLPSQPPSAPFNKDGSRCSQLQLTFNLYSFTFRCTL